MQINPKIRVFALVTGFVLLLIMPVSYAIFREYKYRKTEKANPKPATDTIRKTEVQ